MPWRERKVNRLHTPGAARPLSVGTASLARADGDAAVDVDGVPRDVQRRVVEGEVLDQPRHLVRLAEALRGDALGDGLDEVLAKLVGHVRLDEARRDGVHGHAARRELLRHRHRHRDHPALGSGVVGLARVANAPHDGRNVDDAALLRLEHDLGRGLRCEEDAVEVGVDDVVPLALLHTKDKRVARDPRVVHQHAHRLVIRLLCRCEQALDALCRGHVRLHRDAGTA
mmetsp:Transcript_26365/g.45065  ORF Transcript_26365/g.45065 Transcript_26365/m.45065 type:complete len:227 (+) Transcript_26365:79-759(+)